MTSFWQTLQKPIIALAPMDGVSDAPFRRVQAQIGRPDIVFTEFTNVEGLWRGDPRLLDAFLYDDAERPAVAQIFGSTPQDFYRSAIMVCELGFDGVDINMGCPSKGVTGKGGGAALIREPLLAQEIVRVTKQGVEDWANGQTLEGIGLAPERIARIRQMNEARRSPIARRRLPVSVKTRLGYDSVIIEDWVKVLLEVEPVAISLHGRTLRQMYTGSADWDAIGRAAEIVRQTPTLILGNGDIHSPEDVLRRLRQTNVHGVLIGRASMGNPWLFRDIRAALAAQQASEAEPLHAARPNATERLLTALQHVRLFSALLPNHRFVELRKHLSWYCRDFYDAVALRRQLVQTNSLIEVEQLIGEALERGVGEREPVGAASAAD
ncbi:MAG TPA: tRNA-dihydrouridine synthase [Ktedonobacterales bacterium]|nr:tRNA-dihydrouridine synthase [Ktedonobacterales bacterium]